jgi:integrase
MKIATENEEDIEVTPDKVYAEAEIKKLIEATKPESRERLLLMVPALTGLRIGEVLALTWPAVDLKAGKLEVRFNLADSDKGSHSFSNRRRRKAAGGRFRFRPN